MHQGGAIDLLASRAERPRRVLLVDDNADFLVPLARFLAARGHDVKSARSGGEALELARAFAPEVAVLDIKLPGMDGYALARHVGAARLIALTGYGDDHDEARSRAHGFHAHFVKPIDIAILMETIERA